MTIIIQTFRPAVNTLSGRVFANRATLRRVPPKNKPVAPRPPKQAVIQIRLDDDLARAVAEKAAQYGGMSPVIRALLRRWVKEDLIGPEDIVREFASARRGRRPKDPRP